MMERSSANSYFAQFHHTPLQQYALSLPNALLQYEPAQFWKQLEESLALLKQTVGLNLIYQLLIKLMDQKYIQTNLQKDYQFLLIGKKMKSEIRQQFVDKKVDERQKYHLLTFISLLGMNEQPQYILLAEIFAEKQELTCVKLMKYIQDPDLRTKIEQKLISIKKNASKNFNPNDILLQFELSQIFQVLMPLNLIVIKDLRAQFLTQEHFFQFKDTQIFAFTGPTGIGKSTIILLCLGYRFDLITLQKTHQYIPINLAEQHKVIVSKYSLESVTNGIHFVGRNYKGRQIFLTDTPGDGDTRGLTRIFLNSLQKNMLFTICKKVKIIKIVDIGVFLDARSNGLTNFVKDINENYKFDDASDLQDKLIVIFNKCDSNYVYAQSLLKKLNALVYQTGLKKQELQVFEFLRKQLNKQPFNLIPNIITLSFHQNPQMGERLLEYLMSKNSIDPQELMRVNSYSQAVQDTKEFLTKSAIQALNKGRYPHALHYVKDLSLLLTLAQKKLNFDSKVENSFKDKFKKHCLDFERILAEGCNKIYSKQQLDELSNHMAQLDHSLIFKPYFPTLKTNADLKVTKDNIINAYKQKISSSPCSDEVMGNYSAFTKLFGTQESLAEPLMLANKRIFDEIQRIMEAGSDYSQLDQRYNRLKRNCATIRALHPDKAYQLEQQTNQYLAKLIKQSFELLREGIKLEVDYLNMIKKITIACLAEPINRELKINELSQKYLKINQAEVLKDIRKSLQNNAQIMSFDMLIGTLYNILKQKLDQFYHLITSDIMILGKIATNFNQLMEPYLQIAIIYERVFPQLLNINNQFAKLTDLSQRQVDFFQQLLHKLINRIQVSQTIESEGEKAKKQDLKLDIYAAYRTNGLRSEKLQVRVARILREAASEINIYSLIRQSINQTKEKETFAIMIEKTKKIMQIQSIFPEIKQPINEFRDKIMAYFRLLSEEKEKYLLQNIRPTKFQYSFKNFSYLDRLKFYGYICSNLDEIDYDQQHLEKMKKIFAEIYQNSTTMLSWEVKYLRHTSIRTEDQTTQIHIKSVFDLFYFLNDITTIPQFKKYFNQRDNRKIIINKLVELLRNIQRDVEAKIKARAMKLADPVFNQLPQLSDLEKEDFVILNQQKRPINYPLLTQLKRLYKQISKKAYQNCEDGHTSASLNLTSQTDECSAAASFLNQYPRWKHSPLKLEAIRLELVNHIEYRLNGYEITNYKKFIASKYKLLNNIKNDLIKESQLQIQELNSFIERLNERIKTFIEEFLEQAEKMVAINDIRQAKKELTQISELKNSISIELETLLDEPLQARYKQVKNQIQSQQLKMNFIKNKLQQMTNINIYQNSTQIKAYAKSNISEEIKRKIELQFIREIDQLKKNHSYGDFSKKYELLRQLVIAVYQQDGKRKNQFLRMLSDALNKERQSRAYTRE